MPTQRNTALLILLALSLLQACTYTQKVRDGRSAYELKQYSVALPMLKKDFQRSKSKVEQGKLAFMLADSYAHLGQDQEAIDWYQKAYDYQFGPDALKGMAYALKYAERYEEAAQAFTQLGLEIGSPYEYRREVTACKQAAIWKKDSAKAPYKASPYDAANSPQSDYAPSYGRAGELIISSDRGRAEDKAERYKWTGRRFSDFYVVAPSGEARPLGQPFNSEFNDGSISISPDGQLAVFARCGTPGQDGSDDYCQLYESTWEGGGWSAAEPLNFMEDRVNFVHPAFAADGQTLYFAANYAEGLGGYDIYEVQRYDKGWATPRALGRSVNSPYDELFPTVDADTLYFASEGHTGMGGLDIFKVYRLPNDTWSPPINLKAPINSGADDFHLLVAPEAQGQGVLQMGYFCSARSGNDDVFRFSKHLPPAPPPADSQSVAPPPVVQRLDIEVVVLENIYKNEADPNSPILGRRPLPGASLRLEGPDSSYTVQLGAEGSFRFEGQLASDYRFAASAGGFLNNEARFSTQGMAFTPEMPQLSYTVEIVLERIRLNQEIVLENIYYDFDQSFIREDAKPALDELASLMQRNPGIRIQLGSHTDCRGRDEYNLSLSQRRAQAAVDYLISRGINAARLNAVGYGEGQPAATCACQRCSEEEHQMNRRTTFAIVGTE